MEKKLILEISRIHEMMGIKNATIIKENTGCPLCDVINSKIDDLARKFANQEIGYSRFQYEVDDLIRKIELDGSSQKLLSVNEIAGLSQIRKNLDTLKKTSDSVDSYKIAVKKAISDNGSLSNKTLQSAKNIKTKIIDVIDWDVITKTPEYADYVFKNSKEIEASLVTFGGDWINKTPVKIKEIVDSYKTIDSYAEACKKAIKDSLIIESGLGDELAENLSNLYKKSIKENTNISKHFGDVSPVIDNTTSKTIERTVIGDGSETKEILFPNISNRYFELLNKNVDELTEEEKLFLKAVEDWKSGKTVDFNNLKKEEEVVVDTGGSDINSENMEDATSGEIYELFGKTRDQVDIEGLNAVQKLRMVLADNADKPTDADVILGNKIKDAIKKGKKFESATDEEITATLQKLGLNGTEIASILKRIKNPIKGYSAWYTFYWKYVEPMFRGWISTAKRVIRELFSIKDRPITTKELTVEFMKSAEKALVNFDSSKNYIAQFRELRNKFGKIRSADPETFKYYSILFQDWDNYMRKNLKGSLLEEWEIFSNKLTSGGDSDYFGFIDVSWKEMLGRELKDTAEGSILERMRKDTSIKKPSSSVIKIFENIVADPSVEKFWEKLLKKGVSWFFTNFFRTPRQMEEFFLQKGYANAKFGVELPVEFVNTLKTQLWRWVYIPAIAYLGYSLFDIIATGITNADWGDADFMDIWNAINNSGLEYSLDKNVYEQLPNWYKGMKSIGIFYFTPPILDAVALGVAIKVSDSEEKFEKGDEKLKRIKTESYNKSVEKANEEALIKYNSMNSQEQKNIQEDALYQALQLQLSNPTVYLPFLTSEEAKFISDRLVFKPSFPLTARASITQKLGEIDFENITEPQTAELDTKNLDVIGNVLLKGKDGDYLAVPTSTKHDPDNIHDKTKDPYIKGYWAWVKPKFNELKINTSRKHYNLKEFVEENK
jgi:thiol-disulfide isomerase/thioredoxin